MVEPVVVDNSVLMPLVFADEDAARSRNLMRAGVSQLKLMCPALCMIEFGNAILNGLKRNPRRLTEDAALKAFAEMASLPLHFREPLDPASLVKAGSRAMRLGLSFYDATYLELALKESAVLATFDGPLARAAAAEGVKLWAWEENA